MLNKGRYLPLEGGLHNYWEWCCFFASLESYLKKKLIQILRDNRMMIGKKSTSVSTMAIKVFTNEAPKIKKAITNAATAKAIPIP